MFFILVLESISQAFPCLAMPSTCQVNHSNNPQTVDVSVLLPHEVMAALYRYGTDMFHALLAGNMSERSVGQFWKHVKTLDDWKAHPVLATCDSLCLERMVPVNIHGDGAAMYREDEYFVYSWSSAFSGSSMVKDVLMAKIPIAIIPEKDMTHPDVRQHVNDTVARLVSWSLKCAAEGVAPLLGFRDEEFDPKSYRAEMAGQQLAGGWRPF